MSEPGSSALPRCSWANPATSFAVVCCLNIVRLRSKDLSKIVVKNLEQQRTLLQEARDRLQAGIDQYEDSGLNCTSMHVSQEKRVKDLMAAGHEVLLNYKEFLDQMKV